MTKVCAVDHCDRTVLARGWCGKHYQKHWLYGDPLGGTRPERIDYLSVDERFETRINKTADCWNWTGRLTQAGYGRIWTGERYVFAHRFSYESVHGKIPDGLEIDHKCHNTACVNPDHLHAVTPALNSENLRGAKEGSRSGLRGVSWNSQKGKWLVRANKNGICHFGGYFDDLTEAKAAAIALRNRIYTNNLADRRAS